MIRRLFSWFFVCGIVLHSSSAVFAGTPEEEAAGLKAKIIQLEKRLSQQEDKTVELEKIAHGAKRESREFIEYKSGERAAIKPAGLTIGAGATFILQGTNNANGDGLAKNSEDVTDVSYSMDLEFEKIFSEYGLAFLHLETGYGAGVEDELKVFSKVNRDADDSAGSLSVTEVFFEHYVKFLPLTLTFGKIDPSGILIPMNMLMMNVPSF